MAKRRGPKETSRHLDKFKIKTVKVFFCIFIGSLTVSPSIALAATLLNENFSEDVVDSTKWHIPTWVSSNDGTFVGRTQFRCSQNASLPAADNGNAVIMVETYNPTGNPPGSSFYGTDLISNQSFPMGNGIHITVRARMNTSTEGIVGGIFLYALKPGSTTLHDEIDFELLTNRPDAAQTNIYSNEPLGAGHPQFVSYSSGSINDYHTYEIKWQPDQVSWLIDGKAVRTETRNVPTGPMSFHLNIWVPGAEWPEAYSEDLQPTRSPDSNQEFWMSVDSVNIKSITQASGSTPLLPLILSDE
jgi:beta-glucanase (GH16 family)